MNSIEEKNQRIILMIFQEQMREMKERKRKRRGNVDEHWMLLGKRITLLYMFEGNLSIEMYGIISIWKNCGMRCYKPTTTHVGIVPGIYYIFFFVRENASKLIMNITPELREDKLTDMDWRDIEDILRLLESFKILIILGEERGILYGSISSMLWGFDMFLGMLEEERRKSRSKDASFQKALDAS